MYLGEEKLNATRKLNLGGVTRSAYYCMPWKSKKVGLKCQVCKSLGLPHGSEPSFFVSRWHHVFAYIYMFLSVQMYLSFTLEKLETF